MYYIVYMKTVNLKWPIELVSSDEKNSTPFTSLADIKKWLKNNNKIFYRDINKHGSDKRMVLYKSQITSITGPIDIPDSNQLKIDDVMTLNEAVDRWKVITNVGTIRKAIFAKRFKPT